LAATPSVLGGGEKLKSRRFAPWENRSRCGLFIEREKGSVVAQILALHVSQIDRPSPLRFKETRTNRQSRVLGFFFRRKFSV